MGFIRNSSVVPRPVTADPRTNGEPPTTLRKRKGVYGCDIMRQKAPDHDHRLKDEACCRELMALTTYRLRDVVQNAEGHWLRDVKTLIFGLHAVL